MGVGCCEMPHVPAGAMGRFTLTQMAAIAELEAGLISERTKAALAAAKASGVKLGGWRGGPKVDTAAGRAALQDRADAFAGRVGPLAAELRERGMSLREIAAELTQRGVRTARDGQWTAAAVQRVLARGGEAGAVE